MALARDQPLHSAQAPRLRCRPATESSRWFGGGCSGRYLHCEFLQQRGDGGSGRWWLADYAGTGLSGPGGVAVDGAGNVSSRITAIAGGGGSVWRRRADYSGHRTECLFRVAVDGAGDVFIADSGNNRVVEVTPGGVQTTVPASGLSYPTRVAVDAAGDVFISDFNNNRVVEVPAGGGAQTTVGTGLSHPQNVAVDAAGDVSSRISQRPGGEVPTGCTSAACQITLITGLNNPNAVALDGVAMSSHGYRQQPGGELQRSQPLVSVCHTNVGSTSSGQSEDGLSREHRERGTRFHCDRLPHRLPQASGETTDCLTTTMLNAVESARCLLTSRRPQAFFLQHPAQRDGWPDRQCSQRYGSDTGAFHQGIAVQPW